MRIITNENTTIPGLKNWMESCILQEAVNANVDIAVAFFTNTQSGLLEKLIENGCYVRMVVRLNYGTSPDALFKALSMKNIQIRFFTSRHFHPKMYIIGDRKTYIGSSNFTDAGMHRNQELNVEIDADDYDFEAINDIFEKYWSQARVLDKEALKEFKKIIESNPPGRNDASGFLKSSIGEIEYNNVSKEKRGTNDWQYYSDQFRRVYQEYLNAFATLQRLYAEHGNRKFREDFPLRMEIDRFLWWIREYKAIGESYSKVSRITDEQELRDKLFPLIDEFVDAQIKRLDQWAEADYYVVKEGLSSPAAIKKLDYEELYAILMHVHAFEDRYRYYPGGREVQKEAFMKDNPIESVKKLIIHLVYDDGDYVRRIYDCSKNPSYKLKHFGEACSTELYGILNNDDIPIRNGRTQKSLQWLGFGRV